MEARLRDAVTNLVAWIENHGVCSKFTLAFLDN